VSVCWYVCVWLLLCLCAFVRVLCEVGLVGGCVYVCVLLWCVFCVCVYLHGSVIWFVEVDLDVFLFACLYDCEIVHLQVRVCVLSLFVGV